MKPSKQPAIVENAESARGPGVAAMPGACAVPPNSDTPFGAFRAIRRIPAGRHAATRKDVAYV